MIREMLAKAARDITAADVAALVGAKEAEDLEFKGPLPWKKGESGAEPWSAGRQQIGHYTRDEILKEVIGLANAGGGLMFLGMNEDGSGTATGVRPLPTPERLAERLHQIFDSMIDPRLPTVQAHGIETEPGMGVVAIRVPASWLRPHKHTGYGHCFVRRGTRAEPMSMREVRDMIFLSDRGLADIEKRFTERSVANDGLRQTNNRFHIRMTAIPLAPVTIGRISRQFIHDLPLGQAALAKARGGNRKFELHAVLDISRLRRGIRAWDGRCAEEGDDRSTLRIEEAGLVETAWSTKRSARDGADAPVVYASWLLAEFRNLLLSANKVRDASESSHTDFAIDVESICPTGRFVLNDLYTRGERIPANSGGLMSGRFPRYLIGRSDSFNASLNEFYVDLLHSAGVEHSGLTLDVDGFPVVQPQPVSE